MTKISEAVITECASKAEELLREHWDEIQSIRHQNPKEKIKISIDYNLEYKGDEQILRTSIGFGIRKTDHRDSVINPNQLEIFGNGAEAPEDALAGEPVESSRRGRKRAVAAS